MANGYSVILSTGTCSLGYVLVLPFYDMSANSTQEYYRSLCKKNDKLPTYNKVSDIEWHSQTLASVLGVTLWFYLINISHFGCNYETISATTGNFFF